MTRSSVRTRGAGHGWLSRFSAGIGHAVQALAIHTADTCAVCLAGVGHVAMMWRHRTVQGGGACL